MNFNSIPLRCECFSSASTISKYIDFVEFGHITKTIKLTDHPYKRRKGLLENLKCISIKSLDKNMCDYNFNEQPKTARNLTKLHIDQSSSLADAISEIGFELEQKSQMQLIILD